MAAPALAAIRKNAQRGIPFKARLNKSWSVGLPVPVGSAWVLALWPWELYQWNWLPSLKLAKASQW